MKRKAVKTRTVQETPAAYDEAAALMRVVADYSFALDLLDDYDHQRVAVRGTTLGAVRYFLIKDHPFVDGNKRIGAALFLWFLEKNDALYRRDGTKRIADNVLVAMTLLIAESKPAEQNLLYRVLVNLISRRES